MPDEFEEVSYTDYSFVAEGQEYVSDEEYYESKEEDNDLV